MNQSSVSTASPERAAWPLLWIPTSRVIEASKEHAQRICGCNPENFGKAGWKWHRIRLCQNLRHRLYRRLAKNHITSCRLKVEDLGEEMPESGFDTKIYLTYTFEGNEKTIEAYGNGPIDAVQRGLQAELDMPIKVLDYTEHALQMGSNAQAAAYIHLMDESRGIVTHGVGISSNITRASIRALFSAVNRFIAKEAVKE